MQGPACRWCYDMPNERGPLFIFVSGKFVIPGSREGFIKPDLTSVRSSPPEPHEGAKNSALLYAVWWLLARRSLLTGVSTPNSLSHAEPLTPA
jgi:hypothetical protein